MAPWVYDEKFLVGTQFLFGTLMFTAGEDENLELQVQDRRRSMSRLRTTPSILYPQRLWHQMVHVQV
jgi:hypothetical protein